MTRKAKQRRRQDPRDSCAAMDRALNAYLERRSKEAAQERQKAFGRIGKRPPGVRAGRLVSWNRGKPFRLAPPLRP
jgi:hypothetical protein